MKKLQISLIAFMALGTLSYAGGDLVPITQYEIEDEIAATEEIYTESIVEEPIYVEPEPIEPPTYVEPEPIEPPTYVDPEPTPPPVAPTVSPQPRKVMPNGFYAGLGITGVNYKSNCKCKNVDKEDVNYGGTVRVGYDFNEYIGVEARGTKTKGDADVKHVGVFIKPMVPVTNSTNVYGLVGVAKTKVKGDLPNVDSDGLAMGAGIEIDLSSDTPKDGRYSRPFDGKGDQEEGIGLFVDYERMIVKDNATDLDVVTAGITYDF